MNLGQLIGELRDGPFEHPRRPDAPPPQVRTIIREDVDLQQPVAGTLKHKGIADRVREYLQSATAPATGATIAAGLCVRPQQVASSMRALMDRKAVARIGTCTKYAYYVKGGPADPARTRRGA